MNNDEIIRMLAAKGILGDTPAEVRQALIQRALQSLVETEYVQKWIALRTSLRGGPESK